MKKFNKLSLFFLIMIFLSASVFASAVDQSFNAFVTKTNGSIINVIVRQPDGKFLIGGSFEVINGKARGGVARFNGDGTIDTGFVSAVGGAVSTLLVQEDGKILVGGSSIGANANGTFRNGILRLNSDGSLDTGFFNGSGGYGVKTIARQADGKILVGGTFTTFNNINTNRIVRLNSDGSLDLSFNAAASDAVNSITVSPNGKITVGGAFTSFNTLARRGVVRLNNDGSLDSTVTTTVDYQVTAVKVLPDGKTLIGGNFTVVAGQNRKSLARLNADGTLDLTFNYVNEQYVGAPNTIEILPDGKILIGGLFSESFGSGFKGSYRLNADGSLDYQFTPLDAGVALAISPQPNGRTIVGGFRSGDNLGSRVFFAEINDDGIYNPNFSGSVGNFGTVSALATQPDGKILAGGDFVEVNGRERVRIARLNADGTLDLTFNPGKGANDSVQSIALQRDGKIVVCGRFGLFNGVSQYNLTRLNTDGSVDSSFVTSLDFGGQASKCVAQPDGKIIIGGLFNSYGGVNRKNLARLNGDGSLDTSFNPGISPIGIAEMAIQPDGKILLCGQFSKSIARLNADGSVDTSFNVGTGAQGIISAFAIQPDGKIVIGGSFSAYNGAPRNNLARIGNNGALDPAFTPSTQNVYALQIQPNGRIVVGGNVLTLNGVPQKYLGRLNTDGTLDYSFRIGAGFDNIVYVMAQEPDGSIIAGGSFRKLDGRDHIGIAKIAAPSAIYDFDGDGKSDVSIFRAASGMWYLQNSKAGFASVQFGLSTDKIVPADYDGDGKTDIAVWRESPANPDRANFYILQSLTGTLRTEQFGRTGDSPFAVGDWDGDGKADPAVYRAGVSGGQSFFFYKPSTRPTIDFVSAAWGIGEDKPVVADYDGDGKADVGVFRPSNGIWYIAKSGGGFSFVQFGSGEDKPVAADYDGDGKADIAVYRPSNGTWYANQSSEGFTAAQFGDATDLPAPADYDGDGKTDIAVFRPANGTFYQQRSLLGFGAAQFGAAGDKPTPNAFVP